jgi:hypothetical protein
MQSIFLATSKTRRDSFYLFFFPELLFRIIPNAARRKQASPKKKINILGII